MEPEQPSTPTSQHSQEVPHQEEQALTEEHKGGAGILRTAVATNIVEKVERFDVKVRQ